MKHKIVTNASCIVMAALSLSSAATDYHVYPDERDGLTGPQQFVDCINKISVDDTIIVAPGTYDFTGIYDSVSTDGGRSHVSRAADPISSFSVIGDTTGHWDDAVVFKGDVRFGCFTHQVQYRGSAPHFANITFDGFKSEANDASGNSGGVFKFALPSLMGQWGWPTVTNCVFKNNSSPGVGTVIYGGAKVYDCKFVDNFGSTNNGRCAVANCCGLVGCIFEGNTCGSNGGAVLHNGYPISNCTFRANSSRNYGAAIYGDNASPGEIVGCHFLTNTAYNRGGAIYFTNKGSPLVTNCTFEANTAFNPSGSTEGGGAVWNDCASDANLGEYVRCTFTGNAVKSGAVGGAAHGGIFRECTFDSNSQTNSSGGGGAVYFAKAAGGVYDCVFTNNMAVKNGSYYPCGGAVYCKSGFTRPIVGSKFYGNSAYGAGAVYGGACTNCVFKDNSATADGGAINGCSAYSCTFEGSRCTQDWTPGWDARSSRLEKCDLRTGGVAGCSLNGCTIRAESGSAHGLFYLNGSLSIAATNCLITGICTNSLKGIIYAYATPGSTSTFVNCTFADITYRNADALLYGKADTITSVPIEFKNCIFSNIRKADGTGEDLSYRYVNSGVSFQNCSYGSIQDGFNLVDAGGTFQCDNPRFAEEGSHQLRHNSPLRGKGALLGWTAADTDLAGNPRVRDGKVDLGCYQCWTNPKNLVIVVR